MILASVVVGKSIKNAVEKNKTEANKVYIFMTRCGNSLTRMNAYITPQNLRFCFGNGYIYIIMSYVTLYTRAVKTYTSY